MISKSESSVVVVTQPLQRNGSVAENHGALEARQLFKDWSRGRREKKSCLKVSSVKSTLLDRAKEVERRPVSHVCRHCINDPRFCQF